MERLVSLKNGINPREYKILSDILKEYSIVPESIERVRSVYKVKESSKSYCLKRTNNGLKKAKKGALLVSYLKDKGFDSVTAYIKTHDGKECVRTKKYAYYLTDWIDGRECNIDDFDELLAAIKLLAVFHINSKGFNPHGVKIESNLKNWPLLLQSCKKDLDSYKIYIEKKKVQTTFDLEYYKAIDSFKEYMEKAISLLRQSNYMEVSKRAKVDGSICHDSYYYQNIMVSNEGKMYIIDLDSVIYDIHVYDIAKFIRRILYKKKYGWDFNIAKELIQSYETVNKLTLEEYEILLAFIIFPQKYWKLGRKRYVKKKKWSEDTYRNKLKRIIKYVDAQRNFINEFMDYYKINI